MDNHINISAVTHINISAVTVQQLHLTYGFGRYKHEVLKNLNLSVDVGTIYGLLGPSGCGKTSLLRCVIGRLHYSKGLIEVNGSAPGTRKSHVPGSGVGYMPQELALHEALTIKEILTFYGSLHRMNSSDITNRITFLIQFLSLPAGNRIIKCLSGGQQRRVSLAVALLHKPPLLVLDEPTVGVDPLLRENIWDHLVEICIEEHVTIIITTHYIEEARQANKIGLMRNGRILIEDTPGNLLSHYNLSTLEGVYLQLCREDDLRKKEKDLHTNKKSILHVTNGSYSPPDSEDVKVVLKSKNYRVLWEPQSLRRMRALMIKNFIQMKRNMILLLFQFILPAIQITAFCSMIGKNLYNVPIAIFNEDADLGVKFLEKIDNHSISQLLVNSFDEGIDLVNQGKATAALHIWKNFSGNILNRVIAYGTVSQKVIDASRIHCRLDNSDPQLSIFVRIRLAEAIFALCEDEIGNRNLYPQFLYQLLQYGDPIYGIDPKETPMAESMILGIILALTYMSAIGLTGVSFINERKNGLFERYSVSGTTTFEIMISHLLTQVGVVVIQVTIILAFAVGIFDVHSRGGFVLPVVLTILQAFCGMTLGFFISVFCSDETSAIMLSTLVFFPGLLMSGTFWPLFGMSEFVQKLTLTFPQTLATTSMRWIMLRARDLTWTPVWLGFLVTLAWIFGFLISASILMKLKLG